MSFRYAGFIKLAFSTLVLGLAILWTTPASGLEKVSLQLRWDHQYQFAGYYVALWQGYYAQEGLEVEIRSAITPEGKILLATKEVAEGRADFGVGAADIIMARDKGADLVVLASIFQQSAARYYARAGTRVSNLSDLTRLKVARNVGDLIDVELQAMLKAEGMNPEKVKAFPHDPTYEHFFTGQVDVAPAYNLALPYVAEKRGIGLLTIKPSDYGINFYGDSLFSTWRLLNAKPDLVTRFTRASLMGWRYALNHPGPVIDRLVHELSRSIKIDDLAGFNRFQFEKVKALTLFPEVQVGHLNPDRWLKMHEHLKNLGLVTRDLNPRELIYDPEWRQLQEEKEYAHNLVMALVLVSVVMVMALSGMVLLSLSMRKRRRAEAALRASEERNRQIVEAIDTIGDGLLIVDDKKNIRFMNQVMINWYGDQTGKICYEVLAEFETVCPYCQLDKVIENKEAIRYEVTTSNGLVLDIAATPFRLLDGAAARLEIIRDVTKRKRNERNLARINSALLELGPDEVENINHLTALTGELLGGTTACYSRREGEDLRLVGIWNGPEEMNQGATIPGPGTACHAVIHNPNEELYLIENLDQTSYGRTNPGPLAEMKTYVGQAVKAGGRKIGSLCLFFKDEYRFGPEERELIGIIASAIGAEEERLRAREELTRSEEKYRLLVENMHDGLVMTNPDNIVIYANKRFGEMLGYPNEAILGRSFADFLDEENRNIQRKQLIERRKGEQASFELGIRKADGRELKTLVSPTPLFDEKGDYVGSFGIMMDLTPIKNLQQQLIRTSKLEAIGQLAAGVAHEINTPTQYIQSNLEFIQEAMTAWTRLVGEIPTLRLKGKLNEVDQTCLNRLEEYLASVDLEYLTRETNEAVRASLEGVTRITNIVNSMRFFAHPGTKDKSAVEINQVILQVVTLSRNEWKYHSDLELNLDDRLPPVPTYTSEFSQALLNIIINAAQAIAEKTGRDPQYKGRIMIATARKDDHLEIRVSDNGPGIPEGIRTRIFEPFFTTKEVGKGTGQGLAIAQAVIVNKHGGTIDFETKVGEGATFIIKLPLSG
ncbi:MAG: ABC transporter substrate-binding protein [Thermodesulfobacteriota bacterium]